MEGPPPKQQQMPSGSEAAMKPWPVAVDARHVGSGKLHNKVALITGGDSGIGRAGAVAFAREGCDVASTSVTAYKVHPQLMDYSASKGAQVAFTYSLSQSPEVLERRIRVNAVAPGPIWTPLIPATFPADKVKAFGSELPMRRPGQQEEVAACYVFLASEVDSSFMSGQVLHPNGGLPVHG